MSWQHDAETVDGRPMVCQACGTHTFHLADDPANFCMHCGSHAYVDHCPHCLHPKLYRGAHCGACGNPYSIGALIIASGSTRIVHE